MKRLFRLIEQDDGSLTAGCLSFKNGNSAGKVTVPVNELPGWLVTEFLGPVDVPVEAEPEAVVEAVESAPVAHPEPTTKPAKKPAAKTTKKK